MKTGTASEVARALGVDRRQVGMWCTRRKNNGFPESVGVDDRNQRSAPLYDIEACQAWYRTYTPATGGRPKEAA